MWFLAGTAGVPPIAERTCTVPADKAVLFPVINCINWMGAPSDTSTSIRNDAKAWLTHVSEMEASVDGVALEGLANFAFFSPSNFFFTAPATDDECVWPGMSGRREACSIGYWLMLEPLSPGPHTIHFRGQVVWAATFPNVQEFETEVTYHLTVE